MTPLGPVAAELDALARRARTCATTENGIAIEAFNRRVAEDSQVVQVSLPLRDGLTLIRRS